MNRNGTSNVWIKNHTEGVCNFWCSNNSHGVEYSTEISKKKNKYIKLINFLHRMAYFIQKQLQIT